MQKTSLAFIDLEIPLANYVMVLCIGKCYQFDVNKTLVGHLSTSQSTEFSCLNESINTANINCFNHID